MTRNKGETGLDTSNQSSKPNMLSRIVTAITSSGEAEDDVPISGSLSSIQSPAEIRLRIAEFENLRVSDVMIPRAEIVAVDEDTDLEGLIQIFVDSSHSRLPIFKETLDDPVGLVHIRDLVGIFAKNGSSESPDDTSPLKELRRELLYVPPSMRLPDLLLKMQSTRMHLALVVDEYGGTDGLVSLEDLVEQIVGEIEDEHDEDIPYIQAKTKGIWEVDARTEIEDFMDEANVDLSLPEFEDEIDTLGGVAFAIAGRVPQRGEILSHPSGADMEILEADTRRIKRIKLRCPVDPAPGLGE